MGTHPVTASNIKLLCCLQVGKRQGLIAGMSLGGMQFIMFCSYALALYYGSVRVTQGKMTGGDVVNVMFAALLGSFSLGMVSLPLAICISYRATTQSCTTA